MKKITALILTVFICMSAFGSVGFAEDNTVMDNSMMEKMEFLKILDIIPDYNELNADLLSKISRFCVCCGRNDRRDRLFGRNILL